MGFGPKIDLSSNIFKYQYPSFQNETRVTFWSCRQIARRRNVHNCAERLQKTIQIVENVYT